MGFLDNMMGGMGTYGTSPSEEEKKRAMWYAISAMGQGLMKGANSGVPGGIGMGVSEGLNSFTDTYRGSLEADEKKRIDRQKTQNALDLDQLQLEVARQNVSEGKTKAAESSMLREARKKILPGWQETLDEKLGQIDASTLDNTAKSFLKKKAHETLSMANRSIIEKDGQIVVIPELSEQVQANIKFIEDSIGDEAIKGSTTRRTRERLAYNLGMRRKNVEYDMDEGDTDALDAYMAKMELEKDQLGIKQQKANIAYTQEGIADRREAKKTDDPKLPLTQSQLNSLIGDAEVDLGVLFTIAKVPGEEANAKKLGAKWGIVDTNSFYREWQHEDKRADIVNAIAINRGMKVKKAEDALRAQMGGGQAVPNPSSEIKVLEPLTVINEARKATGDDRTREELKKKYPGLTDQQIKLQFGF